MKIRLIGIAGSSCSGKTTLLRGLEDKLGDHIATLSFDEYFIGDKKYGLDNITNFERPDLYNYSQFIDDLQTLKAGHPLSIRTNSRESQQTGQKTTIVTPKPIIFIEGFLIFYKKAARELFDTKIYIDLDDNEILKRRFARSAGDKHWDSRDYIQDKLIPYHHKYVEPQRQYADLVLDGQAPADELVQQVANFVS